MPFVDLTYIEAQHDHESIVRASHLVHAALMEHFLIPEDDYFHLLHPITGERLIAHPHYLIKGKRSDKFLLIRITCGDGRSQAQKRNLYAAIADAIHGECAIPREDVFIILYETDRSAWSFGEGKAQMIGPE